MDRPYTLKLFGDAGTELAIMHDGDERLFAGYESNEFLVPVFAVDFLKAELRSSRLDTPSETFVVRNEQQRKNETDR